MINIEDKVETRFGRRRYRNYLLHSNSRIWTGIFLLLIGGAALLRNFISLPDWLFSWEMILIVIGMAIGIRSQFRYGAGVIMILIGIVFLINDYNPGFIDKRLIWPLALMALGAFFIFKPRHQYWDEKEEETRVAYSPAVTGDASVTSEVKSDAYLLDSTSVFGGIKKTILSKNFKGGEIINFFGGTELNLSQADIQGSIVLEVIQVFGGTKIILPPHWEVKSEMAAVFAGIDDKRTLQQAPIDPGKVLILKGTSIFGGIEIRSY